jgi:hypothetical protein
VNGSYVFTSAGREYNKQWGFSKYQRAREARWLYTTVEGRRVVEARAAAEREREAAEQERLREKYAHVPHIPPGSV